MQCGKWIHSICAGMIRVTPKFSRNCTCRKCDGNVVEALGQEEKLCDEVETVGKFTYLGDRVSAGGGCAASVIAGTRCGWVKFRQCGELLGGWRLTLWLKGAICKSCVRPAILCEVMLGA